jgi:site-specific recombinase XerD
LDQVRDALRLKHSCYRTEQACVAWICPSGSYVLFHSRRHPNEMGAPEVEAFLTHLAVDQDVAASTQSQALRVLPFLYREVLRRELEPVDALRAKRPRRLPTVLTQEETRCLLGHKNAKTTMIYTHACTERSEGVLNRGGLAVRSPPD